ncbi:MAG: flagellar protein FlgN [Phycisphaerae bacterium]|nr:flagellar protein FlgN [Phycisphaerae bacterium]
MTTNRALESRSGELVTLMGDLKKLHEELLAVVQQKLAAMKRADTEALNSCLAREQFLADRIRQREGLRQQLVQIIARELGLDAERVRELSLKDLAGHFNEPRRGQLLALAASVRGVLEAIDSANRVAALVTGEMLKHFRQVYSAMAQAGGSSGRYSAGGQLMTDRPMQVFEAVG